MHEFSKINFQCSCWRKLYQTYRYLQKVTGLLAVQVFWKFTPDIGPLEDKSLALCLMLLVSCTPKTFNLQNTSALAGHAWRYSGVQQTLAFWINLRKLLIAQLWSCFRVTVLNTMTHASELINLSVILPVTYRYVQVYHIKISRENSTRSCQKFVC